MPVGMKEVSLLTFPITMSRQALTSIRAEGRPASIENPRDLAGKRARRWRREKEREKEVEAQHLRQERSKRLQNYVGDTDEDRDNKISSELKSPPEMEALRELGLFPPSPFVP